jgi:hypothetical protein
MAPSPRKSAVAASVRRFMVSSCIDHRCLRRLREGEGGVPKDQTLFFKKLLRVFYLHE